ncbi:MAG: InlB B-repeat-containing protein, partial [Clostridia bacterium]|nr:InlB B-repeat-containing protein [Clostridia bacterium]
MGKTIMSKIKWLLALCAVTVLALVGGIFSLNTKAEAKAEEPITITQVQFRTSGESCFFFLRMDGQTDYTELNKWHDPSMVTSTNLLDKVHLYFLDGSATLREAWTGESCGTYIWGESHSLVFQMKSEYKSNMGTGARIDAGAEIPMLDGTKKVTSVTRTFWSTHNTADNAIGNYTDGYNVISAPLAKVHLRGMINIGLGEGNDWVKGEGSANSLPTQVPDKNGSTEHSGTYWRKMLACNFLGKVKLHVKETDTWVTLGSILNYNPDARQITFYYNNWGEKGGTMQIDINTAYNGTTIDQILFEKGCEFPSYDYLGNADMAYTVQVLDTEYLCTSNDMTNATWAVDWAIEKLYEVTYLNEDGSVYTTQKYKQGETIALPAIPEKAGYEGAWTMAGGEVPTMMPANHVTLQLKYEEKIVVQPKVTQVQFRTS